MRIKILVLGLICLFAFAYCNSPADPEIEKALNPPDSDLDEPLPRAILEVTTNPELPIFTYDSIVHCTFYEFIIIITETNGVGGQFDPMLWTDAVREDGCGHQTSFANEIFEPYGTIQIFVDWRARCKPTIMTLRLKGYDNNNYEIDVLVEIPFVWVD